MPLPAKNRASTRWLLLHRAFAQSLRTRQAPTQPQRILIAQRLLLGDTLMLAALFAALRERYPVAEITVTCAAEFLPLFATHPYGVIAKAYNPRDPATLRTLCTEADAIGGYDLALVPGDNRYALLARALGARWVVAMAGDRPAWKNWLCDELLPWPDKPTALADIFASLSGLRDKTRKYRHNDWPTPVAAAFERPTTPYAILHIGAGSPLRLWPADHWQALASDLARQGIEPVWSCGPNETALLTAVNPEAQQRNYPGTLDLAQLWQLLAGAALLVCPDTGIAHLGKLVGVPTLCLFGPGSPDLFGAGDFWSDAPFLAAGESAFPCRDQRTLFKRELTWVRRCQRRPYECSTPLCMAANDSATVIAQAAVLLSRR